MIQYKKGVFAFFVADMHIRIFYAVTKGIWHFVFAD